MALKCKKCGHDGPRNEFKIIYHAADPGPDMYRQCTKCKELIYSDELEQDEQSDTTNLWGLSSLRGKVFRRKPKDEKSGL